MPNATRDSLSRTDHAGAHGGGGHRDRCRHGTRGVVRQSRRTAAGGREHDWQSRQCHRSRAAESDAARGSSRRSHLPPPTSAPCRSSGRRSTMHQGASRRAAGRARSRRPISRSPNRSPGWTCGSPAAQFARCTGTSRQSGATSPTAPAGSRRSTMPGRANVEDVATGGIWYFPSGLPHSLQGIGPDGCEFILCFDDGNASEYNTLLLTEWMAHTPPAVLAARISACPPRHSRRSRCTTSISSRATCPDRSLPTRRQAAGKAGRMPNRISFALSSMAPTRRTRGGEVRVVDSRNFPAARTIAAALVTVHPGGLREMHWHPNADEWQYYIDGQRRDDRVRHRARPRSPRTSGRATSAT